MNTLVRLNAPGTRAPAARRRPRSALSALLRASARLPSFPFSDLALLNPINAQRQGLDKAHNDFVYLTERTTLRSDTQRMRPQQGQGSRESEEGHRRPTRRITKVHVQERHRQRGRSEQSKRPDLHGSPCERAFPAAAPNLAPSTAQ